MKSHPKTWAVAAGSLLSLALIGCNPPVEEPKKDLPPPTTPAAPSTPTPESKPAEPVTPPADTTKPTDPPKSAEPPKAVEPPK